MTIWPVRTQGSYVVKVLGGLGTRFALFGWFLALLDVPLLAARLDMDLDACCSVLAATEGERGPTICSTSLP